MTQEKPQIDLLLPHKERFTAAQAGAVATVARDLIAMAPNGAEYRLFATPVDKPLLDDEFQPLIAKKSLFQSTNKAFANAYLEHLKRSGRTPDLIEVHGRCQVALLIAKARPDLKVCLYLHNDPRTMRAGKSVQDRTTLTKALAGVISVSHYIENCFFDGLDDAARQDIGTLVNWLGVNRRLTSRPARKKQILMAGRMVPEKGFIEASKALVNILPSFPDWSLHIAGGRSFTNTPMSAYERELASVLEPLGDQAHILGHRPFDEVRSLQEESEICIVPSLWEEPGGTAVLEAMAAGAALITTARGGLPEVAKGRALIVEDVTPQGFEEAIHLLVADDAKRTSLQKAVWDDYPFSGTIMAEKAARFRAELIS